MNTKVSHKSQVHRKSDTPASANSRDDGETYLTRRQLAAMLGTSERTLARWHQLRIGPARIAVGNVILYRTSAVHAWLRSQEVLPVARQEPQFCRGRT